MKHKPIMKHEHITIKGPNNSLLKGLLWGNNVAWICECDTLNGSITSGRKDCNVKRVCCLNEKCQWQYEITSSKNDKGNFLRGPARDIKWIKE